MSKPPNQEKLWSGRFTQSNSQMLEKFNASVEFDCMLAPFDIQLSIAYAGMLQSIDILTHEECQKICDGLNGILKDVENNQFKWLIELEDVHMNIEHALIQRIGDTAKKLHTARSRNDQVATDIRLYLRHHTDIIGHQIHSVCTEILQQAKRHIHTIMPGYTHLQNAQPVSFSHHLMCWLEMLMRDLQRLKQTRQRINQMPLGSAALAGSPYPVNRKYLAEQLGFEGICLNSMDAVSDRDFAIEFTSNASVFMVHLSRMCEEIIVWMSTPFGFVDLPDHLCTGSSIMPQKKNPDVPELIRGKTGRVVGHLNALICLMKGQPLAYNKDNQEDKEPLFDTVNTLQQCTVIFSQVVHHMQPNTKRMEQAAHQGYTNATDLADYLSKKNIPFRDAHRITGKIVQQAIENNKMLQELSLEFLQKHCSCIEKDVFKYLEIRHIMDARNTLGGTAPKRVKQAIASAEKRLKDDRHTF